MSDEPSRVHRTRLCAATLAVIVLLASCSTAAKRTDTPVGVTVSNNTFNAAAGTTNFTHVAVNTSTQPLTTRDPSTLNDAE